MRYFILLLVFTSLVTEPFFSFGKNPDVKLEVRIAPEEGWMNGGYGSLFFKYINHSGKEIRTGKVTGEWEAGGENYNNWDWNPRLSIPAGSKKEGSLIAWMPPKTEKLAIGSIPVLKGEAVVFAGDEKLVLPYSVKIPVAQLPSPLVSKKGKYIKLILQEQTWKEVKEPDKVVDYVDKVYETMLELTGNRPFNGDLMALKECPRNPYFAYAGNPVILNRTFVPASVKRFDNDEVDFGWIHEIGHNFDDVIGHYYNYGTFTEFQANIKLSYVIEKLCTEESSLRIKSWVDKTTLLTGKAFNDEYFAPFDEKYLKNPERSWESLASDEYHALFHRVIRKHGWGVMKRYYRTFGKLNEKRLEAPEGVERIFLALAVLNQSCDEDLIPLYKKWRIPLDRDKLMSIGKKYQLDTI